MHYRRFFSPPLVGGAGGGVFLTFARWCLTPPPSPPTRGGGKKGLLALAGFLFATTAHADPARVLSYSDAAFQENYTAAVIAPFNKAGATNQAELLPASAGSAGMLGQLRTQKTDPQLDVVIMDTTTSALACTEGLVERLTPALVPEIAALDPQAVDGGCSPGVTFDHLVIAYNAKAVTPAPTSLAVLADPKWKGRLSVSAPPNIQALALTAVLSNANGGDWHKADGAFARLRAIAPNVQTFDPQPDGLTLIQNGTVDFATNWNARAQLFHERSQGLVGVMLPTEGTVLQINTISLVKGAPHRDAALAFIRYALAPAAQKAFTEALFYGPTNKEAQIRPDVAARTSAGAENRPRIVPVDWNEMVKLRDNWTQRWRREVIAASGR